MGVDYDGVGGIGIRINQEMTDLFIAANLFTEEEWEEDEYGCLEELGLDYAVAGDGSYTGKPNMYYLLVNGNNLEQIIENEKDFLDKLKEYGVVLERKDLIVISDLHVY